MLIQANQHPFKAIKAVMFKQNPQRTVRSKFTVDNMQSNKQTNSLFFQKYCWEHGWNRKCMSDYMCVIIVVRKSIFIVGGGDSALRMWLFVSSGGGVPDFLLVQHPVKPQNQQ